MHSGISYLANSGAEAADDRTVIQFVPGKTTKRSASESTGQLTNMASALLARTGSLWPKVRIVKGVDGWSTGIDLTQGGDLGRQGVQFIDGVGTLIDCLQEEGLIPHTSYDTGMRRRSNGSC